MRLEKSKFSNTEEAVRALRSVGFTYNLKLDHEKLTCLSTGKQYSANQTQLLEIHRFDLQNTSAIVLAIKCHDGTKGILIHYFKKSIGSKLTSFIKNGKQLLSKQVAASQ